MSLAINTHIASGDGEVPSKVRIGSTVRFVADGINTSDYWWEIISKPEKSSAYLTNMTSTSTNLVNIDRYGNYGIRLYTDRNTAFQKSRLANILVPNPNNIHVVPPEPLYDSGGRILNFSFELPGLIPGSALMWKIKDDAGLLSNFAGISRGRIVPTNFNITSGRHVMCLGDDVGNTSNYYPDQIFSVSQQVDLTDMRIMTLQIKLIKRT